MHPKKAIVVIPARLQSSRLPNKPLVTAGEPPEPLVWHTWSAASQSEQVHDLLLACDDQRIADALPSCAQVYIDQQPHQNGTSRVHAALAARYSEDELRQCVIVNWQVDEPLIQNVHLDLLTEIASDHPTRVCTLVRRARAGEHRDPHAVKAVLSRGKRRPRDVRHYGSRDHRKQPKEIVRFFRKPTAADSAEWVHLGIYAYSWDHLTRLAALSEHPEARRLSLEQVTWQESDARLLAVRVRGALLGVNTPQDLERWRQWIQQLNS